MKVVENNYVLALSKEHKLILETLGELDSILKLSASDEMISQLKNIIEPFLAKLIRHQEFEEEVIFKSALEAMPSERIISIVLRLQKDHGVFLTSIEAILSNILYLTESDNLRQSVKMGLSHILNLIKKHSIIEVKELFPLITSNSRCRQLIEQYAKRHTN
ncbi:MAG: hypothetical protein CVV41_18970 [Candidatus Riflebacteria bacterium HGW-Riflebacteria-1]|jgi:hemerythrin-like domain-containing protein|nr:MAG: hypothetical protein CVV41_18970 [Candidatus Riflebacteria bacterium HGW-Riflebacteria-1]